MKSATRNPQSAIACFVLAGLALARGPASAAEAPAAPSLPDIRSIVQERGKAVARIETFEGYLPGLVRRGLKLVNPFPITATIGDAVSLALFLPSAIIYPLRKHVGSGVLFDAEGYLLTNHHVVRNADRVTVRLTDAKGVRRDFNAEVVGIDPHTDTALVKIDPQKFPLVHAPLGDSDKVALGDWIVAIGNPFRLTGTVTLGIVSGLHRQVRANLIEDYIQVDAAVNPGNSGGPLLNTKGEVVGLVELGTIPSTGIGFAVPTNLVAPFLDDLKKHGRPRRGYLGVNLRDLSPELAKVWKVEAETGVLVTSLAYSSPAGKAGIRKGDLIEAIGGKRVATAREAQMAILRTPPGTKLAITVRRGGKPLDLEATVAPRRAPFRIL